MSVSEQYYGTNNTTTYNNIHESNDSNPRRESSINNGETLGNFQESPTFQRQQQHHIIKNEDDDTNNGSPNSSSASSFLHKMTAATTNNSSYPIPASANIEEANNTTPYPQAQRASMSLSESPRIERDYNSTPPMNQPIGNNGLYTASYSAIPVFELLVKGVAVMRRKHDSWLNATQILKIAGVEKAKRTKILEREILIGEHEKVQGGYGKYQGTWIPYDRGVDLCKQYGVYEMLLPLLDFEPSNQMEHTPTKEQALAKRKRESSMTATPGPPTYTQSGLSNMTTSASFATRENTLEDMSNNNKPLLPQQEHYSTSPFDDDILPDIREPLNPLDPDAFDPNVAQLITRLFVQRDENGVSNDPVVLLRNMSDQLDIMSIDIPIDDSGHTALHWASALAIAPLVKELVKRGANQQRANYAGETTLVRAILVTNSFDSAVFPELLESLYPALPLIDKQGRTVLHHVSLTAGIKGRSGASKYYLECLLEWIVRRGSKGTSGRYGLDRFMRDIVNAQDKNGDTALNIAARVGNKSISQQLLDVGANPYLANRAGLRPIDFGVVPNDNQQEYNNDNDNDNSDKSSDQQVAKKKRKETIENIKESVNNLETEFDQELSMKQQHIDNMHSQLRDITAQLTEKRNRLDTVKTSSNKLVELDRSAVNLERAIEEEDTYFKEQQQQQQPQLVDFEGNFDADEPFRVPLNNTANLPPSIVLKARIAAYRKNQDKLQSTSNELRGRSAALEQKFKKVVSLCTGVEENRVDSLLEGLVQAVQSDRDDVDVNRVAGFLRKVE